MNLADIRKKAIMERDSRKDTVPAPPQTDTFESVPVEVSPETLPLEEECIPEDGWQVDPLPDFPDEPSECEPEPQPDIGALPEFEAPPYEPEPEPAASLPPPEPPVIATPAIPAAGALGFSAPAIPLASDASQLTPVREAEGFRGTLAGVSFNPLAILMAGRESAGLDVEIPAESAEVEEVRTDDYQEFLCFRVSTEEYAVNIMEIKEIIKPREITEVPRVPDFVSGILSLRGIIIPVFDMQRRLHLTLSGAGPKERIIVVSKGEELFGIRVDEVLQVVRISENLMEQPPAVLEGIDRDFVLGIGRHDGRMLIMLNLAKILDVNLC